MPATTATPGPMPSPQTWRQFSKKRKDGYLDKQAGMKLRHEIYEAGDSRDVNVSIEKFLGRKQSIQPFLKKIGIGAQGKNKAPAEPSQEGR